MDAASNGNPFTEQCNKEEIQEESTVFSECTQTDIIVVQKGKQSRKRKFTKIISKSKITSSNSSDDKCVNGSSNLEVRKEPAVSVYVAKVEVCTNTENQTDATAEQETLLDVGKKTKQTCGISDIETKHQTDSVVNMKRQQQTDTTSKLCESCGRIFLTSKQLRRHVAYHKSEKVHKCKECSYTTKYQICMQRHQTVHTGERKFTCDICAKTLTQAGNLKTHMLLHTEERPFRCQLCNASFRQKINLQQHQLRHWKDPIKHERVSDSNKKFPCEVCGKRFARKQEMQRHRTAVHDKLRAFHCTECDKQFSQECNLRTHMKIHAGQRDFSCAYCEKSYRTKSALQYHLKIRTGSGNDKCEHRPMK